MALSFLDQGGKKANKRKQLEISRKQPMTCRVHEGEAK